MSHDPQIAHTQNSFLPENSNSLMAFTRPSRNSPLPLHPQFQPVTCTNSSFQRHQQNYIHLNTPYCYTSSSPYTCYFWYWNYHPFSQFLLQTNSYPLWKRAPGCSASMSHLNNLPQPLCANPMLCIPLLHLLYFTVII